MAEFTNIAVQTVAVNQNVVYSETPVCGGNNIFHREGSATMIVTPAAAEDFWNVHATVYIDVPRGCCATVAVVNTSTQPIGVQNANLIVERVA